MLSGTITIAFSLQIQAELLLASPPLLASHCFLDLPLFPCQDQLCLPAAWLGAWSRWALLARQSLLRLCGAGACPGLVLPCWQFRSPQLSFAGG